MVEKIKKSLQILRACLSLLKKNKRLLYFPLSAFFISALFYSLLTVLLHVGFDAFKLHEGMAGSHPRGFAYFLMVEILLFAFFLGALIMFINCALTYCVLAILQGERVSIRKAARICLKKSKTILAWSFFTIAVAFLLVLPRKIPWLGHKATEIALALAGISFGMGTTFVIPILIFEDQTLKASFLKSLSGVKNIWAELLLVKGSLQILISVVRIPLFIFLFYWVVLIKKAHDLSFVDHFLESFLLLMLYSSVVVSAYACFNKICDSVLYTYATTGMLPAEFSALFPPAKKNQ